MTRLCSMASSERCLHFKSILIGAYYLLAISLDNLRQAAHGQYRDRGS
jgi:hypothetical protein